MIKDQAYTLRRLANGELTNFKMNPLSREFTNKSKIIIVTSSTEESGKTNFTLNLSCHISSLKKKVLIIDNNTNGSHIDNIVKALRENTCSLIGNENINIFNYRENIDVLIASEEYLWENSKEQKNIYPLLKKLSESNTYDYIVVDTTSKNEKEIKPLLKICDEMFILVLNEQESINRNYSLIKAVSNTIKPSKLKVISSKITNEKNSREILNKINRATKKFLNFELEYVGFLSEDSMLPISNKKGVAIAEDVINSKYVKCIESIARKLY